MKKLISLALATAMTVSMAATAFATTPSGLSINVEIPSRATVNTPTVFSVSTLGQPAAGELKVKGTGMLKYDGKETTEEDVLLEYKDGDEWKGMDFNSSFGPPDGFTWTNGAATFFRATFLKTGTYTYSIAIVTAGEEATEIAKSESTILVSNNVVDDSTEPDPVEEAKNEAIDKTIETVDKLESVAADIKEITGNLPVAVVGTVAAAELEKICKEAGLKTITVEVDGKKSVAPVLEMDITKMDGKISYTINDLLAGSGLYLELKCSDGNTYRIPTALLKKAPLNRAFYTESYMMKLAVNQ